MISADGVADTFRSILEQFQQLSGLTSDKKAFLRNLSKLISILVRGNYNTVEKIKKIIKITIDATLGLCPYKNDCEKKRSMAGNSFCTNIWQQKYTEQKAKKVSLQDKKTIAPIQGSGSETK